MNGSTTLLSALALVALASACGRLNFAEVPGDGASDGPNTAGRSLALPGGGQFQQVAVSPDGTWYAIAELSGAFRSTNQGATWTRCAARIGQAIAVTNDNTVWMAGADVARSTDHCATWTETGNPRYTEYVYADGDSIFALTDQGLRTWTGTQWNTIATPLDGVRFNWMTRGASRYFVGTSNGLLTSPDRVTWTAISTGFANLDILQVTSTGAHSYAITGGGPGGISCSDATGATWVGCYPTGGFAIAVDPANDQRVIAGIYDNGAVTMDAFSSYTVGFREMSMDAALIRGETFLPNGDLLLASDRGVFSAPAGSLTFSPHLTGLDAWHVDRILVAGSDLFLATPGGVLRSANGAPFTISTTGIDINTNIFDLAALPDGRILAGGRLLFISADRGATWTSPYGPDSADGYRIYSLLVTSSRAYAGTGTRVLTSDPPFTTWTPHALPNSHAVFALQEAANGRIWAGTDSGLYVSIDSGVTWMASAVIPNNKRVNRIVNLADGSFVVATSDGIWKSNATQTSWGRAGFATEWINAVDVISPAMWIATRANGVSYSRDEGTTWTPLPGAETAGASAAILDDTTGQLLIGGDSRGLIRVPMP